MKRQHSYLILQRLFMYAVIAALIGVGVVAIIRREWLYAVSDFFWILSLAANVMTNLAQQRLRENAVMLEEGIEEMQRTLAERFR